MEEKTLNVVAEAPWPAGLLSNLAETTLHFIGI